MQGGCMWLVEWFALPYISGKANQWIQVKRTIWFTLPERQYNKWMGMDITIISIILMLYYHKKRHNAKNMKKHDVRPVQTELKVRHVNNSSAESTGQRQLWKCLITGYPSCTNNRMNWNHSQYFNNRANQKTVQQHWTCPFMSPEGEVDLHKCRTWNNHFQNDCFVVPTPAVGTANRLVFYQRIGLTHSTFYSTERAVTNHMI